MPDSQSSSPNGTRRAVSSVDSYKDAEHAVDWLSDHEFPVERISIVGTGLRYVEQVSGRLTTGRAALNGAGMGTLIGIIWGLLAFSIVVGAVFGALFGAIGHYASGGERDFSSKSDTRADHYEVQVEDGYSAEAERVLSTMPAS